VEERPFKKEIDVLQASFVHQPNLKLLISCKNYSHKAEPADVQEWAAVTTAFNKYGKESQYLGVVICPAGFTSGCEGWATMHNLALIPMVNTAVSFSYGTILRMTHRVVSALDKRLSFPYLSLHRPPRFYEFCYHLLDGFQNREHYIREQFGVRFLNLKWGMPSTFMELVHGLRGLRISDITIEGAVGLLLSENNVLQCKDRTVRWGPQNKGIRGTGVHCKFTRFRSQESCEGKFILGAVARQRIVSLGDWGHTLELGLENHVNLSIRDDEINIDYDPPIMINPL
jgi:hypothetical protein